MYILYIHIYYIYIYIYIYTYICYVYKYSDTGNTSKQRKMAASTVSVNNFLVKMTLRLFYPLSVVAAMVPTLLRQLRRSLQIKKIITNAPRVL